MDRLNSHVDWTLLQSFASISAHGSLSAAARATGAAQPTLSRHISALEQQLGERLFNRSSSGLDLTETGARLMEHAAAMAEAATRFSIASEASSHTLAGSVRITASQIVATYILPDILTELRVAEPQLTVELVASDQTENLLRRDADIAVRMYRPRQADIIAKKVGELELGMFAAKSYIARRGTLKTPEDLLNHDVIGYDRSTLIIDGMKQVGLKVDRDFFAFRSDDQVVCWSMVVAGLGIGFNQRQIGLSDPRVDPIETAGIVDSLPVWLTAHAELRTNPRIRYVYDFLADQLG